MSGQGDEVLKDALDVLELTPDASIREVRASYRRLKDLYVKGSLATSPVEEDLSDTEREELIASIEAAYTSIVKYMEGEGGSGLGSMSFDDEGLEKAGIERLDGRGLKLVRELLGVGLGEVEMKTRITSRYLLAIEDHNFSVLPEEVFVQGYVSGYAKALGLDHKRAIRDFLSALHEWKSDKKSDDLL